MQVRRRLVVHGRVHGVGFRVGVARAAATRGFGGWARNRPDGTVEVTCEGEEEAVESLVRYCREGPRAADVTRVDVSVEEPEGLTHFDIG